MNNKANESYRLAGYNFAEPYSFVRETAIIAQAVLHLQMAERPFGMYINAADHFIVFANKSFYWIRKDREVICPYSSIKYVKLPESEEDIDNERAIEVALEDGDFIFLPVFGDTENDLDIYFVAELLEGAITSSRNIEALSTLIRQLEKALSEYKVNPASWKQPLPVQYFETVIAYLENCMTDCLEAQPGSPDRRYDQAELNQPETWKLITEVLLAPRNFLPGEAADQERQEETG